MEKSSKRGKIPQSDWPSIMARYEAGETLSSIARTYDCSPPAQPYRPTPQNQQQYQHANHDIAPPHTNTGDGGHPMPQSEQRKEASGAFIDRELRVRVEADIAAFLAAFDAALAEDTSDSRAGLREATDRLLRAGARTRIELERLEARMPLPPRDTGRQEPAWRQR